MKISTKATALCVASAMFGNPVAVDAKLQQRRRTADDADPPVAFLYNERSRCSIKFENPDDNVDLSAAVESSSERAACLGGMCNIDQNEGVMGIRLHGGGTSSNRVKFECHDDGELRVVFTCPGYDDDASVNIVRCSQYGVDGDGGTVANGSCEPEIMAAEGTLKLEVDDTDDSINVLEATFACRGAGDSRKPKPVLSAEPPV
mmetsp:Transcript_23245/g.50385  ORF Transcript_23245/g.50385 Transcript_23245/m.50385 type:complete len:203 (-) Transcript_23245:172-780(-)